MDVIIGQIITKLKTLKNSCKEKYFKNGKAKFYIKNNNIYNTAKFSHKVGEMVNGKEINIFKNKTKHKYNSKRTGTQKNKNTSNITGKQNSKIYTNTNNSTSFNPSNSSNSSNVSKNFTNSQITETKSNNTSVVDSTNVSNSNQSFFDKESVEPINRQIEQTEQDSFKPEPTPEEAEDSETEESDVES